MFISCVLVISVVWRTQNIFISRPSDKNNKLSITDLASLAIIQVFDCLKKPGSTLYYSTLLESKDMFCTWIPSQTKDVKICLIRMSFCSSLKPTKLRWKACFLFNVERMWWIWKQQKHGKTLSLTSLSVRGFSIFYFLSRYYLDC